MEERVVRFSDEGERDREIENEGEKNEKRKREKMVGEKVEEKRGKNEWQNKNWNTLDIERIQSREWERKKERREEWK